MALILQALVLGDPPQVAAGAPPHEARQYRSKRVAKVHGPRIESDSRGEVGGWTIGAVANDPAFEVFLVAIVAVSGARPQSCVVIERHLLRRRPHRLFTSCGKRSMSRAIG